MNRWKSAFPALRRVLPLAFFLLGCFPSRGLYFLVNEGAPPGAHVRTHQPALRAPVNPRPKLNPDLPPLPKRLSRIPRALKEIPALAALTDHAPQAAFPPRLFARLAPAGSQFPPRRSPAGASPPDRAPPSIVS